MNTQETEMLIWEYIDGLCDEHTKIYVAQMIASDVKWKSIYDELLHVHQSIPQQLSVEEPSMRFTKNILEATEHIAIAPAAKTYINPFITRMISGFFILSIIGMVIYAIGQAISSPSTSPILTTTSNTFGNSYLVNTLIWINVLAVLVLLDVLLRKKRKLNAGS